MAKDKSDPSDAALERVRAICFGFPGTAEKLSWGAPTFHVRGKMFLMFSEDDYAGGTTAWVKSTLPEQRRLVAEDKDRFFVPKYMGVKGWVGVRLDHPKTDWVELAIIVEEGWASVVPKSIAKQPPRPPPPPPKRAKTDREVAKAALEKLASICDALPESTIERENRHASFRVRKKTYAWFLDNHHGDGIIAACFKAPKGKQRSILASDPKRFFSPAYMGAHGWVGIRVDAKKVDWKDVAARIKESYRQVAPKKLLAAL